MSIPKNVPMENPMTYSDRLQKVQKVFTSQNIPSKPSHLAKILGVAPSSLSRWLKGEVEPRGKQKERIDILYRMVCEVENGNPEAKKLLPKLVKPLGFGGVGSAGIAGFVGMVTPLSLGMAGVLFAAGLGWLLADTENRKHDN